MTKETFKRWYETYRKGTYVPIVKVTDKDGFEKHTRMVGRFVNYYNIASVKAKGTGESKPRDYEQQIIPHILKTNLNTQNDLLMVYTTNHHKAHTKYYYKGVEISKEEYYKGIGEKEKNYAPSVLFSMKLNDILSVGGIE